MSEPAGPNDVSPGALRVGPWTIDARARRVTGPSGSSRVEPKAMAVLLQLAGRPGEVVGRDALLSAGWGTEMATDDVLSRAISELRRALGDDPRRPRFVETIRGAGYRLMVPDADASTPAVATAADAPPVDPPARPTDPLPGSTPAPQRRGRDRRPRWRTAAAAGATLIVATAVTLAWRRSRSAAADGRATASSTSARTSVAPLTTLPGEESGPSLSADGTRVAYAWLDEGQTEQHIHVKLLGSASELAVTAGPGRDQYPAWSPDGSRLAFVRSDGDRWAIYDASSLGGEERLVVRAPAPLILGLDWSADGGRLAYAAHDSALSPFGVRVFALDSGVERRLTGGDGAAFGDIYPAFSPDGRTVAFVRFFNEVAADVYVVPAAGGTARRLTFDERAIGALEFAADGKSVLFGANRDTRPAVWRVPVDGRGPITEVLETAHPIAGIAAARDGRALVVAEASRDHNLWRVAADGRGAPVRAIASTRADALARHSPDGSRIAFVSDRSGASEVWIATPGDTARITNVGGVASAPAWSPDGTRVAFERRTGGKSTLWVADVERRVARRVETSLGDAVAPSWSHDGRWIYVSARREGKWEIWRLPVDGGRVERMTASGGLGGRETRDGRALIFAKPSRAGLWHLDLSSRKETLLSPEIVAGDWTNWEVGAAGVYFVRRGPTGQQDLRFHAFGAASSRTIVAGVRVPVGTGGITLAPNGASLLYAQIDRRDGDLLLVTTPEVPRR